VSLRVKDILVRAVLVPLRRPVIADIGRFDHWPLILVDVETHGGVVGNAYVAPYRARAVSAVAAAIRDLAEPLRERDVAPVELFGEGRKALNVVGLSGISTIAISAVDMALWDARAKSVGLPLVSLLGGTPGPVRAYNSNGLWRHEISTLGQEARDLLAEGGFSALKLRLGNQHLRDDLAAIAAVRDGSGSAIDLMVDFNQALGFGDAIRRCHELDDQGLYWFEEPITYDNIAGYAQLASKVRTPLQMGENYYGARDLFLFLAAGAVHYAMADLMRIGGVTGWLHASSIAAAAGVQLSNHLYPELAVHLLRVTPTAHWLEWVDWANPVVTDPLVPADGQASVPNRPGVGLEWNEAAVSRFAISI
jgi:mandelate racemase